MNIRTNKDVNSTIPTTAVTTAATTTTIIIRYVQS